MTEVRTLTRDEARRFYDGFGRKQDAQSFYEKRALAVLRARSDFAHALCVVELGCGTGKLAQNLLRTELPNSAKYVGLDLSDTMVGLTTDRTGPFGERARIIQIDGSLPLPLPTASADRFLATYVFDLLAPNEIADMLQEARRILTPGGLLCIAGLTPGTSGLSRWVTHAWEAVHRWRPSLVGGCRPLRMASLLIAAHWDVHFETTVTSVGIASEVVVASPPALSSFVFRTGDGARIISQR